MGGDAVGMSIDSEVNKKSLERANTNPDPQVLCLWLNVNPHQDPPPFGTPARFFGLWHEHRRGAHKGLHEFYWDPQGKGEKLKLAEAEALQVKGEKGGIGAKTKTVPGEAVSVSGGGAGKYVLLLNTWPDNDKAPVDEKDFSYLSYKFLKPEGVHVVPSHHFDQALMNRVLKQD